MRTIGLGIALGTIVLSGCFGAREPRTIAAEQQALCGGSCASDNVLLQPNNIKRVEPLYGHVNSGPNGFESRLIGAKLLIQRIEGVTADSLAQSLRCHEARELLRPGAVSADPYWLPGRWLDIDAKAEGAGYVVSIQASDFDQAKQVLDRANAFVAGMQPAVCD
jgi:hypothetical protein